MTDINLPADKTLLLVDDDKPFLTRLARAMETRGFEVRMAESVAEGIQQVKKSACQQTGRAGCGAHRLWQYRDGGDGRETRCD
jgi:CheY-like chemotaxis protein